MTRRQLLLSGLSAAALRGAAFGLPVNTRPKFVFSVGQSLAEGGAGDPSLSHAQPYTNQMFVGGVMSPYWPDWSSPSASIASLLPMTEGTAHDDETHCSGFANQIGSWARANGM